VRNALCRNRREQPRKGAVRVLSGCCTLASKGKVRPGSLRSMGDEGAWVGSPSDSLLARLAALVLGRECTANGEDRFDAHFTPNAGAIRTCRTIAILDLLYAGGGVQSELAGRSRMARKEVETACGRSPSPLSRPLIRSISLACSHAFVLTLRTLPHRGWGVTKAIGCRVSRVLCNHGCSHAFCHRDLAHHMHATGYSSRSPNAPPLH
jgi:hypothetical protein